MRLARLRVKANRACTRKLQRRNGIDIRFAYLSEETESLGAGRDIKDRRSISRNENTGAAMREPERERARERTYMHSSNTIADSDSCIFVRQKLPRVTDYRISGVYTVIDFY